MSKVAAVDIGATSGRVILAELAGKAITLTEVARFANQPVRTAGALTWDMDALQGHVIDGLATAVEAGAQSGGIDTWAVDYAVVREGDQVGPVRAYRDPRHAQGVARVREAMPWNDLYATTGVQDLPFNTIYQIAADSPQRIVEGSTVLMVPDLLTWRLTGSMATDATNASSTGMVDVRTRTWSAPVLAALGLPASAFLPPDDPGEVRGSARDPRLAALPIIGVATHDTASAFVGTPMAHPDAALVLSLGTWALIGAEVMGATPTPAARELNVTHELGADGTVRVLRNVCGMWLLEECRRAWGEHDGIAPSVSDLLAAAERAPRFAAVFDVDTPSLSPSGQSPGTIAPLLHGPWDGSRGAVVRAILESLVVRLAQRADEIERLLGSTRPTIHVVGGASRMGMVLQWLADATGKQVVAGPVEATAVGNAVLQWQAHGDLTTLAEARDLVARLPEIRTYEPHGFRREWQDLAERLEEPR